MKTIEINLRTKTNKGRKAVQSLNWTQTITQLITGVDVSKSYCKASYRRKILKEYLKPKLANSIKDVINVSRPVHKKLFVVTNKNNLLEFIAPNERKKFRGTKIGPKMSNFASKQDGVYITYSYW